MQLHVSQIELQEIQKNLSPCLSFQTLQRNKEFEVFKFYTYFNCYHPFFIIIPYLFFLLFFFLALVKCGDPGSPVNGQKLGSRYWTGESVLFICHTGYHLIGSTTRMCLPSGSWSGTQPSCKRRNFNPVCRCTPYVIFLAFAVFSWVLGHNYQLQRGLSLEKVFNCPHTELTLSLHSHNGLTSLNTTVWE